MKKQMVTMLLVTIFAVAGSVYTIQAAPMAGGKGPCMGGGMGAGAGMGGCGARDGGGCGRYWERMTQALDLTADQQARIKTLVDEEQAKTATLRQQMLETRESLQKLIQAETFDETAVRELAVKKAELSTELMVSRARLENGVQAQLTPEQKKLAEKIQPAMGGRHGMGHCCQGDCDSRPADCPRGAAL